jgi:hypothetical protein
MNNEMFTKLRYFFDVHLKIKQAKINIAPPTYNEFTTGYDTKK